MTEKDGKENGGKENESILFSYFSVPHVSVKSFVLLGSRGWRLTVGSSVLILCEYATLNGGERSMLSTLGGIARAGYQVRVARRQAGP